MGAPRVTAQETAQGEPRTFDRAVNFQSLDAIMAASGIVPAHSVAARHETQPRRDAELIETDEQDEQFGHDVLVGCIPKRFVEKLRERFGVGSQSEMIAVINHVEASAVVEDQVEFVAVVGAFVSTHVFGDDLQGVDAFEFGVVLELGRIHHHLGFLTAFAIVSVVEVESVWSGRMTQQAPTDRRENQTDGDWNIVFRLLRLFRSKAGTDGKPHDEENQRHQFDSGGRAELHALLVDLVQASGFEIAAA